MTAKNEKTVEVKTPIKESKKLKLLPVSSRNLKSIMQRRIKLRYPNLKSLKWLIYILLFTAITVTGLRLYWLRVA
jgi:hypothetical protein